jgi:hypothetical protein
MTFLRRLGTVAIGGSVGVVAVAVGIAAPAAAIVPPADGY